MHLTFGTRAQTERFFWRWRKLKPGCGSMWERCSRMEPLDLPSGGWCPPPSMMMMMMMMMMSPTFKISNMRDNTARHYCVTLSQRQSVWEMNWRIGKPWIIHVYIDSKCLNRENGKCLWKTNLDVHAFAHASCFPLDNRNFQRVCPVVLFVPGMKFDTYRSIIENTYFHSYMSWCAERLFLRPPPH